MNSSSFFSILLTSLLALQLTLGAELLNNACLTTTSTNFTSTNVKTLLKLLTSKSTLVSTGFAMGSAGQAYGLINCRPDVSSQDCRTCAQESVKAALSLCPGSQGAVLWYDSCILKYSDSNFLGSIDTANSFWMRSPVYVSDDPDQFNSRVTDMLTKMSKRAVTDPKLFATGKTKADANTTVYGMVSCTRDLSSKECGSCLEEVVGDYNVCCNGVKGGRYIAASCMFRFEVYPF